VELAYSFLLGLATSLLPLPCFASASYLENLTIKQSEIKSTLACTKGKLCVEITAPQANDKEQFLKLSGVPKNSDHALFPLAGIASLDKSAALQVWPTLIRFKGGILAGVQAHTSTMYSGGGGNASTLHLIAFLPDQAPFKVLSLPQSANTIIRACFSERDSKQRDEYNFHASLTQAGASRTGMPVLRYRSVATSYPGPVSRAKDSLADRPLRKRDLITVRDPTCSYQRLYRFDQSSREYQANTPPPDCSDYTAP
jgi:hypothetical protein